MVTVKHIAWVSLVLILAGCETGPKGVRFTDGSAKQQSNKPKVEAIRNFNETEIRSAIVGKTFQYTRADGNGFVTYQADGTFVFEDDSRGKGTGRWGMVSGQYCETFGASAVQECGDFKYTGDAYFAAKSRLVEMKS